MDSLLVWVLAGLTSTAIIGAYLLRFRRREQRDNERLTEAKRLGLDRPKAQFPYIDPDVCIGCGSCVKACPEGDVLGLVGGLAVVVNGARCIGISQCETACPVGAIEVGLGEVKGRADVPVLDERRQTNRPGIYVAGELGGLALIRNAVAQGRETVQAIADDLASNSVVPEHDALDLLIVGAGPAGLSAALAATEKGLRYRVLEQEHSLGGTVFHYPRRKLTHTQPVELPLHGLLKKREYSKEELLELFQGLVDRHQLSIAFGEKLLSIEGVAGAYKLQTSGGEHFGRAALLALGRRGTPRKLGTRGENLPKVAYQVRDAELYRHMKILCVGGGDSAVEAAMGLARQPGNQVSLSYRGEGFFKIKKKNQDRLQKLIQRGRIRPLLQSQVQGIDERTVTLSTPDGEIVIENDQVFVLIGGIPPFALLKKAGVRFGDDIDLELRTLNEAT